MLILRIAKAFLKAIGITFGILVLLIAALVVFSTVVQKRSDKQAQLRFDQAFQSINLPSYKVESKKFDPSQPPDVAAVGTYVVAFNQTNRRKAVDEFLQHAEAAGYTTDERFFKQSVPDYDITTTAEYFHLQQAGAALMFVYFLPDQASGNGDTMCNGFKIEMRTN